MAKAVKQLWPDTRITIGPAIEDGFYYDFDKKEPFTDTDLSLIEERMWQIIKKMNHSCARKSQTGCDKIILTTWGVL